MTDTEVLVRKFVLHSDAEARLLFEFLKQRKELMERRGKVFQVVVSEFAPSRRLDQNAKMWKVYLGSASEQIRSPRMNSKGWAFVLKCMFLPELSASGVDKWKYLKNGDRELSMSTGDLNEDEFDVYLAHLEAYLVTEHGVRLPANPRDYSDT